MVEAECKERRLFAFPLSSLVVRDDVEMIDRRLAKLRSRLPSSASSLPLLSSFSLSSSLEEEEEEEADVWGAPVEFMDGGDCNETVSES